MHTGPQLSPRRARMLGTLSATFWILILAIVVLFAFFIALGAFKPGEVLGVTAVVAGLAVLWIAHAAWDARRRGDARDAESMRHRERRGF